MLVGRDARVTKAESDNKESENPAQRGHPGEVLHVRAALSRDKLIAVRSNGVRSTRSTN